MQRLSETGQGMTEYAIILAVVATVSVIVFMSGGGRNFGNAVEGQYQRAGDAINKIEVPASDNTANQ